MQVIGIVGLPGSGKGECSRIAGEIGIPVVTMGDVIRNEVKAAGLPPLDSHMGETARQLREKNGDGAIAMACIPVIVKMQKPAVLIDGIRGDAEVRVFADNFPSFTLIAIVADTATRLSRLQNRKRSDDCMTLFDLSQRDARETGFGLLRALEMADITIENSCSLPVFHERIRDLLRKLVSDNEI
ncbi:MAG: flagellar hook-basal body complex protein FliE [Methanospirillaceae archaeon]|nr:flagellar hook-basal body complex protein FliE [Methanospirillaceae archaeon]